MERRAIEFVPNHVGTAALGCPPARSAATMPTDQTLSELRSAGQPRAAVPTWAFPQTAIRKAGGTCLTFASALHARQYRRSYRFPARRCDPRAARSRADAQSQTQYARL